VPTANAACLTLLNIMTSCFENYWYQVGWTEVCDFQVVDLVLSGGCLAKGLDDPDFKTQSWLKERVWSVVLARSSR
jgi:hypothetical protein